MNTIQELLQSFAGQARFVGLTYRTKSSGELARWTLIIGTRYSRVLADSRLEAELMLPHLSGIDSEACKLVIASLDQSILSHQNGEQHPDYTKREMYVPICVGLNLFLKDYSLEIAGLKHNKMIIEPGVFKQVKSSELTIAKNKIRAQLSISRYRTFALDSNHALSARLQGETIEFD